jgi:hypothetical protein
VEELQLVLTPSRVDQRNQGIMLANWRVGQTINALVRDRLPSGSLILTVGGHSFVSSTDIPVQPGDKIALEVKQIEPTLLFRLTSSAGLEPKSASTPTAGTLRPPVGTGMAALLDSLAIRTGSDHISSLINAQEVSRLLSNNALNAGRISAGNISAVLTLSGLFTEALWSLNHSNLAAKSTKTVLLLLRERIINALSASSLSTAERKSLERMLGQTDARLSSTTYQQIASLPNETGPSKWLTSLPLQWGEKLIEIDAEIHRPVASTEDEPKAWKFCLSFELEKLGPVRVEITLLNQRLQIEFQVDEHAAVRVSNSLATLKAELDSSGLEVEKLDATSPPRANQYSVINSSKTVDFSA